MEIGINYSTQAAVLLDSGRLPISRFKVPDWENLIQEARTRIPCAVHFDLNAGNGKLRRKHIDRALKIAAQTQTPFINLHLGCKAGNPAGLPTHSTDQRSIQAVFELVSKDIELALEIIPPERLILENLPYRKNGNVVQASVQPALISSVVEEFGCGFLFDIAHARISAISLGMDEQEYMLGLPLSSTRELHFTGVHNFDGWLQDHLPALESDWQALEWVFSGMHNGKIATPWFLALEYGGVGSKFSYRSGAQEIESQVKRLKRLVQEGLL